MYSTADAAVPWDRVGFYLAPPVVVSGWRRFALRWVEVGGAGDAKKWSVRFDALRELAVQMRTMSWQRGEAVLVLLAMIGSLGKDMTRRLAAADLDLKRGRR